MDPLDTALYVYRVNRDPLALDAIRALTDETTPSAIKSSILNYLDAQYDAIFTLFGNSGMPKHK